MSESDLDGYFPSSSGSETSEYDITSDEEDSDCDYSLKDARRWGTLRPNRGDLPENFNKITLKKSEIAAFQRGKITVLRWSDKKYVSLLSSIHTAKKVIKPAVVMDYNLTMGGVDRADQALVCYPTTRKRQKRYYITIFRHLLDMAIWNAFILRKKQLPNIDNYDFRIDLVERIIENFHVTAPRSAKRQKLQSYCPLRLTPSTFRT
ncbi:uncharacterized protein CDAR_465781 [Caerostris darwini]|uniref:PiggyBac transposable element-derived protein domain-containing protein n=1 Tax=Caerostris darwini TaxID=1538125 RepID=A0AAV4UAP2_9ARAC|nr:uncharacterized protein CDAR_465781 [Caerostris darwini]